MSKQPSDGQWNIHLESVYRRDREERVRQAFEIVAPETLRNCEPPQEELVRHGKRKNRFIRESIQ